MVRIYFNVFITRNARAAALHTDIIIFSQRLDIPIFSTVKSDKNWKCPGLGFSVFNVAPVERVSSP